MLVPSQAADGDRQGIAARSPSPSKLIGKCIDVTIFPVIAPGFLVFL
jgi:hypothetical protein